jgi:hypothetical protein
MTMRGNLGQIHRNLESAAICNRSENRSRSRRCGESSRFPRNLACQSRNLAQAFVSQRLSAPPQILEKLPTLHMG